jgi:hypothetical protein
LRLIQSLFLFLSWVAEDQWRTDLKEGFLPTAGPATDQSRVPSYDFKKGLTLEHMREDKIVKEWLKRKHDRSQIYNLRAQCNKKRRQGKHPETARECLLEWFNDHGDWPYPSVRNPLNTSRRPTDRLF